MSKAIWLSTYICFMSSWKIAFGLPNFVFRLNEPTFRQEQPEFPQQIRLDGIEDITLVTEALEVNISSANITIRDLMNVNYLNKITYPTENYIISRGLDDVSMMSGSVAISEDYAVTSSNGKDKFTGEIYVFAKTNNQYLWDPFSIITSPDGVNSNFGYPVITDNDRIITAATALDGYTGRVYIFSRSNRAWFESARFESPLGSFQSFGHSLDLQNDIAIVGTMNGVVFVYEVVDGEWVLTFTLRAPDENTSFGHSVSLDGDFLAVGAATTNSSTGVVYLYQRHNVGNWSLHQTFPSISGPDSQFGATVALHNGTLVVGAIGYRVDYYNPTGAIADNTPGIVYVYKWREFPSNTTATTNTTNTSRRLLDATQPGSFYLDQIIHSPINTASYFGMSIRLVNGKMIIGADGYPKGLNSGAAFVYYNPDNTLWTLNVTFPSPAGFNGHFGFDVDISESHVIIGAYGYNGLEGQAHIAPLPTKTTDTTPSPTLPPAGSTNIDNKSASTANNFPVGMIVAMALGGLLVALVASLLLFCCCCRPAALPVLLKKKKKEEEDSPYIVHSYVGYSEMDDHAVPPPRQPSGGYGYFFYPGQYGMMGGMMGGTTAGNSSGLSDEDMMLKKKLANGGSTEKEVHTADEGFLRRMFPYKVYSFRGYQGDGQEAAENSMKKIENDFDQEEEHDVSTAELRRNTLANRSSRFMSFGENPPTPIVPSGGASIASSLTMDTHSSFNSEVPSVDLSFIRQGLKAHHDSHASDYVQSMYYANQQKQAQRQQSNESLIRLQPLDAERDQIRRTLMKKVSSGLSDVAPALDDYRDDDSVSCYSEGSSVQQQITTVKTVKTSTVLVSDSGEQAYLPPVTNTTTTTTIVQDPHNISYKSSGSKVPSTSQVESAKAKYAKYLAAVKKNPEFVKHMSTMSGSSASTTSSGNSAHSQSSLTLDSRDESSSLASNGSSLTHSSGRAAGDEKEGCEVEEGECCDAVEEEVITTKTVRRTVTTTTIEEGADEPVTTSNTTTTTTTSSSNRNTSSSPEPHRYDPHKSIFHSPSMEIDVALTEPMKFVTLEEIDETDELADLHDGKSSLLSYASSTVHTDPEAREDLVAREEIERLKSIDHVRKLVYEGGTPRGGSSNDLERQKDEETRLQEDAKLRAEEKARARFALFKSKAEQMEKQAKS